eukprot:7381684-Prymnesium_polylepis.2
MVALGRAFAALTPFALIALVQFARYSNSATPWELVKARARAAAGGPGTKIDPGPPKPFDTEIKVPLAANGTATYRQVVSGPQQQVAAVTTVPPVAAAVPVA